MEGKYFLITTHKTFSNCIKIFVSSLVLGVGLLFLAYLLPVGPIKQHVFNSVDVLQEEGDYTEFWPSKFVRLHPYNMDSKTLLLNNRGMARDNHTDALMLGAAAFDDGGMTSAFQKALLVFHDETVIYQTIESLAEYSKNGVSTVPEVYPRYWHGYLVVLKPLLLVFTYKQIRILNVILLTILFALACRGICKKISRSACIAFVLASLMTFPIVIPYCMQYCTMTYITLISMNTMLYSKGRVHAREIEFFLLVGIITAHIDFLTYPVMALGCLLILKIALSDEKVRVKELLGYSLTWAFGYGGMWASKWVIADLFTEKKVIRDAINQAVHRTVGDSDQLAAKVTPIRAIAANLSCYTNIVFLAVLGAMLLVFLANMRKNGVNENWRAYLVAACIPVLWMCVLQNHSYDHSSFTYRALLVSFWGVEMISVKR